MLEGLRLAKAFEGIHAGFAGASTAVNMRRLLCFKSMEYSGRYLFEGDGAPDVVVHSAIL